MLVVVVAGCGDCGPQKHDEGVMTNLAFGNVRFLVLDGIVHSTGVDGGCRILA